MTADQVAALGADAATVAAYQQKDKLLTFDREHAKRTHVNDASADYYESATWLSPEEKAALDEKERRRREASRPSNRRYKMSFDLAGRRVIEVVADVDTEGGDDGAAAVGSHGDTEFGSWPPAAAADGGGGGRGGDEGDGFDDDGDDGHVLENDGLAANAGRLGDVYREIRSKFAGRRAAAAAAAAAATAADPGSK
jgi:hypothetical protein